MTVLEDRIRSAWEGEHHAITTSSVHGSQGSPRFSLGMFTSLDFWVEFMESFDGCSFRVCEGIAVDDIPCFNNMATIGTLVMHDQSLNIESTWTDTCHADEGLDFRNEFGPHSIGNDFLAHDAMHDTTPWFDWLGE